MPEIQEIDLAIGPNGEVTFEVRGISGGKCEDLTKDLEAILGGKVTSRDYKPSFHEQSSSEKQSLSAEN